MQIINGTLSSETSIHANDNRGLNYGDAVFETLRVQQGKILFWEDHYFRLMSAMRIMRMEIPMEFTPEALSAQIQELIEAHELSAKTAVVKLLVFRKTGGLYRPEQLEVEYTISLRVIDSPFYTLEESDYEVELYKDHYLSPSLLSTLKTNNKALQVLGSIYADENDYQNCLVVNTDKQIVEALNGNLFLVKGDRIKTPPISSGCLNGIMRKQILKLLLELPDYLIEEGPVSPFELQKADEMFITNVVQGIRPVTKYRKKQYSNTVAKDLIGKLNARVRLS